MEVGSKYPSGPGGDWPTEILVDIKHHSKLIQGMHQPLETAHYCFTHNYSDQNEHM